MSELAKPPDARTAKPIVETSSIMRSGKLRTVEHSDRFWEWRDGLLQHPEGRAVGGEPCVQCGTAVPPNADWRHRDRHVCSSRCNTNLSRKFRRKLKKLGENGFELPMPEPTPDPRDQTPEPLQITTIERDGRIIEFGHLGFAPRPGDQVIRFGETTHFLAADGDVARRFTFGSEDCIVLLVHDSGWVAAIGADKFGRTYRTLWGVFSPDGQRFDHIHQFEHDGRRIRLASETIRDVDEQDRDVEWSTFVWVPVGESHPGTVWTDRYHDRSERLQRTSRSQSAHSRRVRIENASTLTKSMNASAGSAGSAPSLSTRTSTTRTRSTRVSTTSCRSPRTASTADPTHNSLTGFATSAKESPPQTRRSDVSR